MKPTFESAKLLLNRAKTHRAEFETISRNFNEQRPYKMFRDYDLKAGTVLFKAKIHSFPIELSAITFDILNCLRSSLDHCVFDSSVILGGRPKPEYTKFPFGKTKAAALQDLPRKRAEVPEIIRPYLMSFKPYQRGNKALWSLNKLRNDKIHRTLSVMAIANQSVGFGSGHIGTLHIDHMKPFWDSGKMELTYMTASYVENVNIDIHIDVFVTFGNETPFAGEPAIGIFDKLIAIVEGVLSGIETETMRLVELTS